MDEEEDSFAPGALFKRYGQEKNDANSATKVNKVNDANVQVPKTSGVLKTPTSDSGYHNKATSSSSSANVQASRTSTGTKNPTGDSSNPSKELSSSSTKETPSNNRVPEAENQPSTSAPTLRTVNTNALLVNPKQRGNPILKSVCNVVWEFNDTITPDYVMGASTCALFLSVRYHNLNPDYIHDRLKLLGKQYDLRILLVQVDTTDPHHALKHLTRICILANLTLVLAWSPEEAGRILEVYKSFEHKPPDLIMERKEANPHQKIINALTSIRSVNKTDAGTLLSTFGSLESLLKSPRDTVGLCPGLGPQKANRLFNVLHQPFLKSATPSKGTKRKSLN